jgi:hypothetical protein
MICTPHIFMPENTWYISGAQNGMYTTGIYTPAWAGAENGDLSLAARWQRSANAGPSDGQHKGRADTPLASADDPDGTDDGAAGRQQALAWMKQREPPQAEGSSGALTRSSGPAAAVRAARFVTAGQPPQVPRWVTTTVLA